MERMHKEAESIKLTIAELDAKAEEVAAPMVQMEQATQQSMVTIRSSYGGHLESIEGQMTARFSFIDGQFNEASEAMRRANEKIGFLEGAMASGGGFSGKGSGGGSKGGGFYPKPDAMEHVTHVQFTHQHTVDLRADALLLAECLGSFSKLREKRVALTDTPSDGGLERHGR